MIVDKKENENVFKPLVVEAIANGHNSDKKIETINNEHKTSDSNVDEDHSTVNNSECLDDENNTGSAKHYVVSNGKSE